MIQAIFFYIFAGIAVTMALLVVSARNPMRSALALTGCLLSVACIFALQSAHLLAILQVLVYAGAIMVFILFVLMLLNLSPQELGERRVTVRRVDGRLPDRGGRHDIDGKGYQASLGAPPPSSTRISERSKRSEPSCTQSISFPLRWSLSCCWRPSSGRWS